MRGNRKHPCAEFVGRFVGGKLCIGTYKGFLRHIFGFSYVTEHPVCQVLDSIFISLDEHPEGFLIVSKHKLDERSIAHRLHDSLWRIGTSYSCYSLIASNTL